MWYAAFLRFIRRRIILGIILTVSTIYCVLSYTGTGDFFNVRSDDDDAPSRRTQPFVWRTLQHHNNSSNDDFCRNSVQGVNLIVDDRGFVCPRQEVQVNGCCNDGAQSSLVQYSCDTCKPNNCCEVYENCVSCCLDPNKRELLESLLEKAAEKNNVIYASVSDHFELCLAKCRTSSESVQHENSYKDPVSKFCFGAHSPGYEFLDEH